MLFVYVSECRTDMDSLIFSSDERVCEQQPGFPFYITFDYTKFPDNFTCSK